MKHQAFKASAIVKASVRFRVCTRGCDGARSVKCRLYCIAHSMDTGRPLSSAAVPNLRFCALKYRANELGARQIGQVWKLWDFAEHCVVNLDLAPHMVPHTHKQICDIQRTKTTASA